MRKYLWNIELTDHVLPWFDFFHRPGDEYTSPLAARIRLTNVCLIFSWPAVVLQISPATRTRKEWYTPLVGEQWKGRLVLYKTQQQQKRSHVTKVLELKDTHRSDHRRDSRAHTVERGWALEGIQAWIGTQAIPLTSCVALCKDLTSVSLNSIVYTVRIMTPISYMT